MLAVVKMKNSSQLNNIHILSGNYEDEEDYYLKTKNTSVFELLGLFDPIRNKYFPIFNYSSTKISVRSLSTIQSQREDIY